MSLTEEKAKIEEENLQLLSDELQNEMLRIAEKYDVLVVSAIAVPRHEHTFTGVSGFGSDNDVMSAMFYLVKMANEICPGSFSHNSNYFISKEEGEPTCH